MSRPRVSVCLPVFRGQKFLHLAIESVITQTFSDFEFLIADDCSDDASVGIIESYAQKDPRIKYWRHRERMGLFQNYNFLLRNSNAEYIKPFAQDDRLHSECISRYVAVLDSSKQIALVSSARRLIDSLNREISVVRHVEVDSIIDANEAIESNVRQLTNWIGEPAAVMFRSCDQGSGFDTTYAHYGDIECWLRILKNGDLFYFSEPMFDFRRHSESQTARNHADLVQLLDAIRLGKNYEEIFGATSQHPEQEILLRVASSYASFFESDDAAGLENFCRAEFERRGSSGAEPYDSSRQLAGFRWLCIKLLLLLDQTRQQLEAKSTQSQEGPSLVPQSRSKLLSDIKRIRSAGQKQ
jgi:glycosyltransferase involved in cell wall biosynthesis